jgi:type VI secretion system secreted protein VgrG
MADKHTIQYAFQIDGVTSNLLVSSFELVEGVSELYELEVIVASDDAFLAFSDGIGKPALLTILGGKGEARHVHGIVARMRHGEPSAKYAHYHVSIVPKLWRLGHRQDSRIFQEKAVPDILKEVLNAAGVADVRLALNGSYAPREYCVQYRETDLAFVNRLMEEEGIFFYFAHTDAKHELVLSDNMSVPTIPAPETVPFKHAGGALQHATGVLAFGSSEEVRPGKVTLTDYNFKKPSLSLLSDAEGAQDSDLEVYDYPGEFDLPSDGASYAKVRLEEAQATRVVASGRSDCLRFVTGHTFTLAEHPREAENTSYFLTHLRHRGGQAIMGQGAADTSYVNEFRASPAKTPHRPARKTTRPTIKGVQTAIVTGPGGEEVHTDEHGRVKVHFHWDRKGSKDEHSSCWIRVSQLWAGAGWGAMWIPRIGHEVIVDFIEGDPDRPIILGRVYHGANVPPYPLPAEKTKSTIKSNSSKGGDGSNELRFEDRKGSEEIFLHGEKDWNIKIENDKAQLVGHDETLDVGNDRKKNVANDQSEKIGNNKSISVTGSHTESIGGVETVTVGLASAHTIGGAFAQTVGAAKAVAVGGSHTEIIGGDMTLKVGGDLSEKIDGSVTLEIQKKSSTIVHDEMSLVVDKDHKVEITGAQNTAIAKTQTVDVKEKYTLKVDKGSVTIDKSGKIVIEGDAITIEGSGNILVKGKALKVDASGSVEVSAGGAVKVKGSGVDIN